MTCRRAFPILIRGRTYAVPQDVFDVAPDILRHRLVLSYEALAQGLVSDQIVARLLSTVPAPRLPSQDPAAHGIAPPSAAVPAAAAPAATPGQSTIPGWLDKA